MASTADLVADVSEKPKTFSSMTMAERCTYIREVVTVEPLLAMYLIAGLLCGPALNSLELEKACKADTDYDDAVCDAIVSGLHENYTAENRRVEELVTDMHAWNQVVQSVVPTIMILFLGSYSDRRRVRKPFLLMPIFGEFFAVAGCILSVLFMRELPLVALGILQTVVPSFFGGQAILLMAVFAYIADVSTLEMRTLRIGIVQIVFNVCGSVVQLVSGPYFGAVGYIGVLATAGVIYALGFLYGVFCIKESRQPIAVEDKKSFLADVLDPRQLIETFALLFRKKEGTNRLHMVIVMIVLAVTSCTNIGEVYVLFYYMHTIFYWDAIKYAVFLGISNSIHLVGTAVGVIIFTKLLQFSDNLIIILSLFDKIAQNVIMVLASTTTMVYIATVVSVITGVAVIGIRSLATKVVSPDDLGKAQSLFGVCETLGFAIGSPVYNRLYSQVTSFQGLFFVLTIILTVFCIALILWMTVLQKRKSRSKKAEAVQEPTKNGNVKDDVDKNGTQMEGIQTTHM